MNDITAVIPVYKENPKIVEKLYNDLKALGMEVIVVDDGNTMDLRIPYITYPANVGYGYALKTGVAEANTPLIVTLDGDGQHTVSDVQMLYKVFKLGNDIDMLIGQRYNLSESNIRRFGRKFLNFIAALISRHYLSDLNSGLRIFRRDLAIGYNSILCDTFSFTTSITMSFVTDNYKVINFPITVQPRAEGKSRVKLFRDGFITLWYILWVGIALRTRKARAWIRKLIGKHST